MCYQDHKNISVEKHLLPGRLIILDSEKGIDKALELYHLKFPLLHFRLHLVKQRF